MTPDNPFSPVYSRQSFLETARGRDLLRRLDDGLGAREPFLLVTGGPGTGKTTLACEAVARWGSRVTVALLAYPALTGADFLEEIVRRFGAEPPEGASRSKLVACVERSLAEITGRGQVAMLVVDDAHDMSLELLEELRLLVNAAQQVRRPLEVLLIGLPTLEARLDEPALAALRQRVSVHATLEPLSAAETQRYLHHRITAAGGDGPSLFSDRTCHDIAARTCGVPRQINALASETLRVARVRGDQTVGPEHVQAAAEILGFVSTGAVEGPANAGSEDRPALIAPPRPLATTSAPVAAPIPAPVVAPIPAPVVAPIPAPVVTPIPTPAVAAAIAARIEAIATPNPTTPANHDPREWVARFVGDKGPLQISSQALPASTWAAEPSEGDRAESQDPAERAPTHRGGLDSPWPRSRSRHWGGLRLATTASLAAIVVVTAVALVMRAGGLARNRAGAGVTTTVAAPQDVDKTSAGSRGARVTRPTGSTTRSRRPYTLDVGGYPDLESALAQRDRLQELTGIEGWVVPVTDSDGQTYRVVLGVYRSHERATAAANMLMNSKTLRNVTVAPAPPRSARR